MSKKIDVEEFMETEAPESGSTVAGEAVAAEGTTDLNDVMDNDDSKIEEPEKVIEETEPVVAEPTIDDRFNALGLNKQFKGGPTEAIEKLPEMNKYITQLEAERNALKAKLTPERREPEPLTGEDLYNDPENALNRVLTPKIQELNDRIEDMRVESFRSSKKDFDDMTPLMIKELEANPEIGQLGKVNAMKILYKMAKQTQLERSGTVNPPVQARPPDKTSAESLSGKRSSGPVVKDQAYWLSLTPEEREKELGVIPRYND